jgi:ABC-2 type transport system ATP-binding protein
VTIVVEADDVTVRRGRRTVLSGVCLTLRAGEAVHVVGANGSGKTSLLRVLAGLSVPRRGSLRRPHGCAFVPEKVVLAPALRCGEWLRTMRALRGLEPLDWAGAVADSGLERDVLGRASATLSRGMMQRIAILEAVHAGCELLLLDEPFSGLDVDGREWLGERLRDRLGDGSALVVSDHTGDAGARLGLAAVLRLHAGGCDDATPPHGQRMIVRAAHADGRRLRRELDPDAVDDLLRTLLCTGWRITEVRACEPGSATSS